MKDKIKVIYPKHKVRNQMNTHDLDVEVLEVRGIKIEITESDDLTIAQCIFNDRQQVFNSLYGLKEWDRIRQKAIDYVLSI